MTGQLERKSMLYGFAPIRRSATRRPHGRPNSAAATP